MEKSRRFLFSARNFVAKMKLRQNTGVSSGSRYRILIALIRICGMLVVMDVNPQSHNMQLNTAADDALLENDALLASGNEFVAGSAPTCTLDQLGKGEHAVVVAVNTSLAFGSLDTLVTRRLWELGFLPGAAISVVGFGLLNRDPIAVKIGGTKFALRRAEALKILVTFKPDRSNQKTAAQ